MKCLVFVKFLAEGSLPPEEFFRRADAQWICFGCEEDTLTEREYLDKTPHAYKTKSGICIADLESIEQLAIDLAIMPGAGISNIEVVPIAGDINLNSPLENIKGYNGNKVEATLMRMSWMK